MLRAPSAQALKVSLNDITVSKVPKTAQVLEERDSCACCTVSGEGTLPAPEPGGLKAGKREQAHPQQRAHTSPFVTQAPTAADADSPVALHQAAASGDEEHVRALLAAGAALEAGDGNGETALHAAACTGQEPCLRTLLAAGADIEAADNHGHTALHWAAACGHDGCLRALLERGASMSAVDRNGLTALAMASGKCQLACMHTLLASGSHPTAVCQLGNTALHIAACNGALPAIRCLAGVAGEVMAVTNRLGQTPRQVAVHYRQPAAERLLLQLERTAGRERKGAGGAVCCPHQRQPGVPQSPASMAAAAAAAEAAAAALLAEEDEQAAAQAAKKAAKAARRRRQKKERERQEQKAALARAEVAKPASVEVLAGGRPAADFAQGRSPTAEVEQPRPAAGAVEPGTASSEGSAASSGTGGDADSVAGQQGAAVPAGSARQQVPIQQAVAAPAVTLPAAAALPAAASPEPLPAGPADPASEAEVEQLMQQLCQCHPTPASGRSSSDGRTHGGDAEAAPCPRNSQAAAPATQPPASAERPAGADAGQPLPSTARGIEEKYNATIAPAHAADTSTDASSAPASLTPASSTSAGLDEGMLSELLCPITQDPMLDPVVAADGNTYDRQAISAWIARQVAAGQPPCSPLSNLPLRHLEVESNHVVRRLAAALVAAGLLS